MQRAAGANQHRAEHGSARRGRRNALTDPRLVRSTGHVMALDFDPTVVGIASQPFWLSLARRGGQTDLACTGLLRSPSLTHYLSKNARHRSVFFKIYPRVNGPPHGVVDLLDRVGQLGLG